jgi:hypothetical protein
MEYPLRQRAPPFPPACFVAIEGYFRRWKEERKLSFFGNVQFPNQTSVHKLRKHKQNNEKKGSKDRDFVKNGGQ